MPEDHALADLVRLCSDLGADSSSPQAQTDSATQIWLSGTPAHAAAASVALRIAKHVIVQVKVDDVLATERDKESDLFRLAVLPQTAIALTTATTTHVVSARFDPNRLLGVLASPQLAGLTGGITETAARSLPPWIRSPEFWTCLGGAASSCEGRHGPLYDDRGFINGELIGCYVDGIVACDTMDRALPR